MEKDSPERQRERSSSPLLHALVHSLTRGEKKYFKQSVKSDTADKNYLDIFELLEKQDVFDDDALYKAVKDKIGDPNSYRVQKQYLWQMILKWMRSYSGTETIIDKEIKWKISDVKFLIEKGFHVQALKDLLKVKQQAEDAEAYMDLIEIISLHYTLLTAIGNTDNLAETANELKVSFETSSHKINDYFNSLHEFTTFRLHSRPVHGEHSESDGNSGVDNSSQTLQAAVYSHLRKYHDANTEFYRKQIDDDGVFFTKSYYELTDFFKSVVKSIDKGKMLPPDLYAQLVAAWAVQARNALPYNRQPSQEALNLLHSLKPESHRLKLEKDYWIYWSRMSNATYLRDQEEMYKLYSINSDLCNFIQRNKDNFRPDQQIRYIFVYAAFLLTYDKYAESREQLKLMINDYGGKVPIRQDIVIVAHLLLLICDYQLKDWIDLKGHIFNTELYFKKAQDFKDDKKVILSFFKEVSTREGKVHPKMLSTITDTIDEWNKKNNIIIKYFDFPAWFREIKKGIE